MINRRLLYYTYKIPIIVTAIYIPVGKIAKKTVRWSALECVLLIRHSK